VPERVLLFRYSVTTLRLYFLTGVALLLAGCGGEQAGSGATAMIIGGTSGTELAADQTLRQGNGAEPQTLDPHRAEGVSASNILRDLLRD